MSYFTHLEGVVSGEQFSGDLPLNNPSPDGDVLAARYDLDRLRAEITPDDISNGPSSLWRYAPMLPVVDLSHMVSLGEGWTPLLALPALGRELGCSNVFLKDEGRNPSGTFKTLRRFNSPKKLPNIEPICSYLLFAPTAYD